MHWYDMFCIMVYAMTLAVCFYGLRQPLSQKVFAIYCSNFVQYH